jgi:hypothetical protein
MLLACTPQLGGLSLARKPLGTREDIPVPLRPSNITQLTQQRTKWAMLCSRRKLDHLLATILA